MKLLTEVPQYENIEFINEEAEVMGERKRVYKLRGPMLVANRKNKNKRIYSRPILEREVINFNEKIKNGSACGTCDHDPHPQVNLDRITHKVESLVMEGDEARGVLRILEDTKLGDHLVKLLKSGIKLGVSSRGVGTLTMKNSKGEVIKPNKEGKITEVPDLIEVNPDFSLISIDVVLNPSCDKAVMESITELPDWLLTESGIYIEAEPSKYKVENGRSFSKEALFHFNLFLESLKQKMR
jgi:hypothetical protein